MDQAQRRRSLVPPACPSPNQHGSKARDACAHAEAQRCTSQLSPGRRERNAVRSCPHRRRGGCAHAEPHPDGSGANSGSAHRQHRKRNGASSSWRQASMHHMLQDRTQGHQNKHMLMKYVTEVDVSVVDTFDRSVPADVTEAFKATVQSLLGSLPPDYFEMHIVTLGDNMRQLMHQFIMTGYLYGHIVKKLGLQKNLQQRALPASPLQDSLPQDLRLSQRRGPGSLNFDGFAPGANKQDVGGTVQRWSYNSGVEEVEASAYIDMLEREVELLRDQQAQSQGDTHMRNGILLYMQDHRNDADTTKVTASPEVREAIEAFLLRLLGTDKSAELTKDVTETTGEELARVLLWLMVVGYTLHGMEQRFKMEQCYALPYIALEDKGLRDLL